MKRADNNKISVILDEDTLNVSIRTENTLWKWSDGYRAKFSSDKGCFFFSEALKIKHEEYSNGIGSGIRSLYEGFECNGERYAYAFETLIWIENVSGNVYFEWIPVNESGIKAERVFWPGYMEFDEKSDDCYTLFTQRQGLLVPNTWETALKPAVFDGRFETAGAYMPWISQVRHRKGYIAICQTPWDAGYYAKHPQGGGYTHVGIWLEKSLGAMRYRRSIRYSFLSDCDYNDICKVYRAYVRESGRLRTLKEKAAANPSVEQLLGSMFVHTGIKTMVQPESDFYDPKAPLKNNHLSLFSEKEELVRRIAELDVKKMYMHIDGWAQPGYDNNHPDYFPVCKEAGGALGMRKLAELMHEHGYMMGIHDQYRDYYKKAKSFSPEYACQLEDGSIPQHKRWAGGMQSYLCASQALYYVKRNFSMLKEQGIEPDCAYLDVFTCNEGDECFNPEHVMSRKDCYEYRKGCFNYLLSKNILTSSEEVSDFAAESLVFCHYAPYEFMMEKPGEVQTGIPVPLFNLVYHDCMIIPWMMDITQNGEDYMLYALLNAGAPYLIRDGAYPGTDGAFEGTAELSLAQAVSRCSIVAALNEKIGACEMIKHEMDISNPQIQKTYFSDKTAVAVDFKNNTYDILEG